MAVDNSDRVRNLDRLRQLRRHHGEEVTVFSAHDKAELASLRGS
jgi:hypothetical protein